MSEMLVTGQNLLYAVTLHNDHAHTIGQTVAFILPIFESLEREMKQILAVIDQVEIVAGHQIFDDS